MAWTKAAKRKYKRSDDSGQNDVKDEGWALIEPLIPKQGRMGRPRQTDLRSVFNAIQYMLASGCQWRLIPECDPPFSTVQNYFYEWSRSGVLDRMLEALKDAARACAERSPEPTVAVIDSQSVKTTESGGPSGYDAGKRIKGRKRHIAVDADGTPLALRIQTADVQDRYGALEVIAELLERAPSVSKLFADGGYQGPKLREALDELGLSGLIEIVEKPKGVKGFTVLYGRWVVERTTCRYRHVVLSGIEVLRPELYARLDVPFDRGNTGPPIAGVQESRKPSESVFDVPVVGATERWDLLVKHDRIHRRDRGMPSSGLGVRDRWRPEGAESA